MALWDFIHTTQGIIHHGKEARHPGFEAAGHLASIGREQRANKDCHRSVCFLYAMLDSAYLLENVATHSGQVFIL